MRVIDECQLAGFRACELAPDNLYHEIPDDGRVVLMPLPPGVGKSLAGRRLARHALERNHDLVVYVAPTRAIIAETTFYTTCQRTQSSSLSHGRISFVAALTQLGKTLNAAVARH